MQSLGDVVFTSSESTDAAEGRTFRISRADGRGQSMEMHIGADETASQEVKPKIDVENVTVRDLRMTATWRPPDTSSVGASMLVCAGCKKTTFQDLVLDTCGTTAMTARDGAKQFTLTIGAKCP